MVQLIELHKYLFKVKASLIQNIHNNLCTLVHKLGHQHIHLSAFKLLTIH